MHDMVATDYKTGLCSYRSFVAWILEGVGLWERRHLWCEVPFNGCPRLLDPISIVRVDFFFTYNKLASLPISLQIYIFNSASCFIWIGQCVNARTYRQTCTTRHSKFYINLMMRTFTYHNCKIIQLTKCPIFWDITPCSPLKVNRCFVRTYLLRLHGWRISRERNESETPLCLLPDWCTFLAGLILRLWKWSRHVPPKHPVTLNEVLCSRKQNS
jgi:hypothetical protein